MQEDTELKPDDETEKQDEEQLSGFSQFIVGELETIGGILTGDPLTQAEGEFNVEVGTARETIEDELEQDEEEAHSQTETEE